MITEQFNYYYAAIYLLDPSEKWAELKEATGQAGNVLKQNVLPLPYHGMKDYNRPPGALEDDPAYKLHPQDWQTYHTRYVTPDSFLNALRN